LAIAAWLPGSERFGGEVAAVHAGFPILQRCQAGAFLVRKQKGSSDVWLL